MYIRTKKLSQVIEKVSGGIYKRIDENRELFELLEREGGEFYEKHPWIKNWLLMQDEFLNELLIIPHKKKNCIFPKNENNQFPRKSNWR